MENNSYKKGHQNKNNPQKNQTNQTTLWKNQWKDQWITDKPDDYLIKFADEQSKLMKENKLTTSQIRNFFSEVLRIKEKGIENESIAFLMLKPKLAYAAARNENDGIKRFKEIMTKAIDLVIQANNQTEEYKKRFNNFHALFEALLAYHKVHGGK